MTRPAAYGYEFEKCDCLGCDQDATFISQVGDMKLFCYCEAHGTARGLKRGLPASDVEDKNIQWRAYEQSRNRG